MSKVLLAIAVGAAAFGASSLFFGCGSGTDTLPGPGPDAGDGGAAAGDAGANDGGDAGPGDASMPDGQPPDTTTCGPGTFEFPFRSGACIDDPCDTDPCSGVGTCSNVTGSAICSPCTRFVDATAGLDTNEGTSSAKPWKTIDKVNATKLTGGDNVCFKRGETFHGGLVVGQSGGLASPLRYGNYGESAKAKPVISGFTTLSAWTPVTPGIWKSPCAECGATVNMVAVNGVVQPMGRYPNRTAANGGYLTYESVIGPASANAEGYYSAPYAGILGIVDTDLPASPGWTGAEVVIRKTNYVLDRSRVTSHSGNEIQYQNPGKPAGSVGRPGWGYFFQDSLQTLDEAGEWYYDAAAHELNVFFGAQGPSGSTVEASSVGNLVTAKLQSYIAFDGIAFRGANSAAFALDQTTSVTITSAEIRLSGTSGITMSGTTGTEVRNSVIEDSNNGAILALHTSKNTVISKNIVQNSGVIPGAGARLESQDEGNYSAILVSGGVVDQSSLIEGNVVDHSGYNGVHFVAGGVTVKNNLITNFTLLLDDGGGIYTWRGSEVYVNRKILGNIVLDGPGAPYGKPVGTEGDMSACIYLDNATSNLEMTGNTMARCSRAGLLDNYAHDVTISGNTSFDSRTQAEIWSLQQAPIVNVVCQDNVFFSRVEAQNVTEVSAVSGQIEAFGTFDHNHYVRPTANDLVIHSTLDGKTSHFHSVESWQAAYGLDPASSGSPIVLKTYGEPTLVGANLATGGDFESGIGSVFVWSATNNVTAKADTSSKLTGTGSLQLTFAAPVNSNTRIYASGPNLGPVSSSKTYLLRVSTLGTTVNGLLSAALGQVKSPYANLTPPQKRAFGTKRIDHEFVFVAPTSDPLATFSITVEERSGTTYLDGIEVYEVTAPVVDPDKSIRFEYNAKTAPATIPLDGTWIDAKNASYAGSITLAPFTSAVLMKPQAP
jgi:hypothetical protein